MAPPDKERTLLSLTGLSIFLLSQSAIACCSTNCIRDPSGKTPPFPSGMHGTTPSYEFHWHHLPSALGERSDRSIPAECLLSNHAHHTAESRCQRLYAGCRPHEFWRWKYQCEQSHLDLISMLLS